MATYKKTEMWSVLTGWSFVSRWKYNQNSSSGQNEVVSEVRWSSLYFFSKSTG